MKILHTNIGSKELGDSGSVRKQLELVQSRLGLLAERDKAIMSLYLEDGRTFRQIAFLVGCHEGTIGRRIKKLMKSLLKGPYVKCAKSGQYSSDELSLIRGHFMLGKNYRILAEENGLTVYAVRKLFGRVKGMVGKGKTIRAAGVFHAARL